MIRFLFFFLPFLLKGQGTINTLHDKTHVAVRNKDVEKQDDSSLTELENKTGKEMIESKLLQEKAVQAVGRKYKMRHAEFITLTSFGGPAPPEGGYILWGVRGRIKGKWYVWQPIANNNLHEGKVLYAPQMYKKCNSPYTRILTPSGNVPIKNLKTGDWVISKNNEAVRIVQVAKVKATNHSVCCITFDDGTVIEISPGHPLADGRLFEALKPGDAVNGKRVLRNELIPYQYEYTWDILPDSPSGTYFVNGIEVASTMKQRNGYGKVKSEKRIWRMRMPEQKKHF